MKFAVSILALFSAAISSSAVASECPLAFRVKAADVSCLTEKDMESSQELYLAFAKKGFTLTNDPALGRNLEITISCGKKLSIALASWSYHEFVTLSGPSTEVVNTTASQLDALTQMVERQLPQCSGGRF